VGDLSDAGGVGACGGGAGGGGGFGTQTQTYGVVTPSPRSSYRPCGYSTTLGIGTGGAATGGETAIALTGGTTTSGSTGATITEGEPNGTNELTKPPCER
jgi:hypothetical protein